MDIGSCCRTRKNVGQWLRLMSVWALSLWPHRIWQEQSQAGVTASIHLLVSCNREGAFVQGHTHTNTHKLICTLQAVFSTQFSKQGCTHLCLCLSHSRTHTRIKKQKTNKKNGKLCTHLFKHTCTLRVTHWGKKSLPGKLHCVSFQEGVVLQCWVSSNVCELSCLITGDKWHVVPTAHPNWLAPDMTTIATHFTSLCALFCWLNIWSSQNTCWDLTCNHWNICSLFGVSVN